MRTSKKRNEPLSYVEWRAPRVAASAAPGMVCNYAELRRHPAVIQAVEDGLLAEQVDNGGTIMLSPFCFAIRQVVAKEIKKLEAIVKKP